MKTLIVICAATLWGLTALTAHAVVFRFNMDLTPLTQITYPFLPPATTDWALALDWGENQIAAHNTLDLTDITGIVPASAPLWPGNGDITGGIHAEAGSVFYQPFILSDSIMHMTVRLTNFCDPLSCQGGDIIVGMVPVGYDLDGFTLLHMGPTRPIGIGPHTLFIGTDAAGQNLYLHPTLAPLAATPEPSTLILLLSAICFGLFLTKGVTR